GSRCVRMNSRVVRSPGLAVNRLHTEITHTAVMVYLRLTPFLTAGNRRLRLPAVKTPGNRRKVQAGQGVTSVCKRLPGRREEPQHHLKIRADHNPSGTVTGRDRKRQRRGDQ